MPLEPSAKIKLPASWGAFLDEVDSLLPEPVSIRCIGGFVIAVLYGLPRPTGDVDYVSVLPFDRLSNLEAIAGRGSPLAQKHKVYLQHVTVNTMSEEYESRLVELFPGRFKNLRLYAPDPYDLILSKLERNSPKDRDDVEYLADTLKLDPQVLRERYERELRPNLFNESRHDLTLKLWLELFPAPKS